MTGSCGPVLRIDMLGGFRVAVAASGSQGEVRPDELLPPQPEHQAVRVGGWRAPAVPPCPLRRVGAARCVLPGVRLTQASAASGRYGSWPGPKSSLRSAAVMAAVRTADLSCARMAGPAVAQCGRNPQPGSVGASGHNLPARRGQIAGPLRPADAFLCPHCPLCRSMVRKGSSVRVRQRALRFRLLRAIYWFLELTFVARLFRPHSVHGRTKGHGSGRGCLQIPRVCALVDPFSFPSTRSATPSEQGSRALGLVPSCCG
jgi:hypothetical protein